MTYFGSGQHKKTFDLVRTAFGVCETFEHNQSALSKFLRKHLYIYIHLSVHSYVISPVQVDTVNNYSSDESRLHSFAKTLLDIFNLYQIAEGETKRSTKTSCLIHFALHDRTNTAWINSEVWSRNSGDAMRI